MTGGGSAGAGGGGAGSRLNWTAVSALAGSIAAVVALVAYLMPPKTPSGTVDSSPSPTSSPPGQVVTPHSPSPVDSSPESSTSQTPSHTQAVQDSPPAPLKVRAVGCDETAAALTAYRRDAGTSPSGQAAAAQQTYSDLMGAALNAQGAVGAKIRRLAAEFQELSFRLTGMTGGDPNQVIADINTDVAEFNRLCASG